jgi:arylsulfatase A-like enzyme
LIVRWPGHVAAGQINNEVVSLVDLVPTWLEVAGVKLLPHLEGQSLLPILTGKSRARNRPAFFERNWHDNLDFIRGIRSGKYLLIQNYRPELPYPPTLDLANSPSWIAIQRLHNDKKLSAELEQRYFASPRPEVELYDLEEDPFQLKNLAGDPSQKDLIQKLQQLLSDWMISTNDFLQPPIPPKRGLHGELGPP